MSNVIPTLEPINLPNKKVAPLLCDVQTKINKIHCREMYFRKIGNKWVGLNRQKKGLLSTMFALQNNPQSEVLEYDYVYLGATTATDPTSGFLKFNNATLASATEMYVAEINGNEEAKDIGDMITQATKIMVMQKDDPAIFATFTVKTNTDNGTWATFGLTYVEGAGALTDQDEVLFIIQNNDDDYVDILECWFKDRYNP